MKTLQVTEEVGQIISECVKLKTNDQRRRQFNSFGFFDGCTSKKPKLLNWHRL